ncbi:MAG: CHRD domain-containing protein [Deltaproteobacteria bacterium]|nr:CHRD domain-containing protein [Deltaproteobacteria bacterium]
MKRLITPLVLAALMLSASTGLAVPIRYAVNLTGAAENPSNNSPGTGNAVVIIDTDANTLFIQASFSGLVANTSDAHIHCCVAPPGNVAVAVPGVGALPGFPLGVTSGTYQNTLNTEATTTYRPAFLTNNGGTGAGAEAALAAGLASGQAYFNIHSSQFPGGEIRGFLQRVAEPSALLLLGLGALLTGLVSQRK